jgi:hypothetical protein
VRKRISKTKEISENILTDTYDQQIIKKYNSLWKAIGLDLSGIMEPGKRKLKDIKIKHEEPEEPKLEEIESEETKSEEIKPDDIKSGEPKSEKTMPDKDLELNKEGDNHKTNGGVEE